MIEVLKEDMNKSLKEFEKTKEKMVEINKSKRNPRKKKQTGKENCST